MIDGQSPRRSASGFNSELDAKCVRPVTPQDEVNVHCSDHPSLAGSVRSPEAWSSWSSGRRYYDGVVQAPRKLSTRRALNRTPLPPLGA